MIKMMSKNLQSMKLTIKASICTCEGVHEGGQRPVEHFEEWISARILLGPTQHGVLQDMRDPCAVHRGGPELHAENAERPARHMSGATSSKEHMVLSFFFFFSNLKRLLGSSLAACRY